MHDFANIGLTSPSTNDMHWKSRISFKTSKAAEVTMVPALRSMGVFVYPQISPSKDHFRFGLHHEIAASLDTTSETI
jgi:hypothetical protein